MILTITLDLSNSAFDDDPLNEAESVMFDAMDRAKLSFDGGEFWSRLKDSNGNAVGSITILTDPTDPKGPDHE